MSAPSDGGIRAGIAWRSAWLGSASPVTGTAGVDKLGTVGTDVPTTRIET